MSADLDLSTPEVPEPTFLESLLRYGLFLGAIFQLVCILAVIVIPTSKANEQVRATAQEGKVFVHCKIKEHIVHLVEKKNPHFFCFIWLFYNKFLILIHHILIVVNLLIYF